MPTVQQLLNDIDVRYKNGYTDAEKIFWMNQVQKQIYQRVPHESPPYAFVTVADQAFYALPTDCDLRGIKQVTLQIDNDTTAGDKDFIKLPYKRKDEPADTYERFYSLVERNLFLNPMPDTNTADRDVYLYYDKKPTDLTTTTQTPDLDENFHELLIYGTLERVTGARKDSTMKSNYANDFNILFAQYEQMYQPNFPEYVTTRDVLPKRGRKRKSVVSLIP